MKKIVVAYWSGTGNTEMMAEAVAKGAEAEGVEVSLQPVSVSSPEEIEAADGIALGCPSMGDEVLEEMEMEPFVASLEGKVAGKPTALFGSFGWGSGEWMENWQAQMESYGVNLVSEGIIVNSTPDEEGLSRCESLGMLLKSVCGK